MAQLVTRYDGQNTDLTWLQTIWGKSVQRLFWISKVPDDRERGGHYHPTCQMALQCLVGSVKVYVQTPLNDYWYTLDSTNQYLLLAPEEWRLMYEFSPDAILLVLAEQPYALTEYMDDPYRPIRLNRPAHPH